MPHTTVIIPEDQPLEALDQWDALVQVAAGAAQAGMARKAQKKDISAQKKISAQQARAALATQQAEEAAALAQSKGGSSMLPYILVGLGIVVVGGVAIVLLVRK